MINGRAEWNPWGPQTDELIHSDDHRCHPSASHLRLLVRSPSPTHVGRSRYRGQHGRLGLVFGVPILEVQMAEVPGTVTTPRRRRPTAQQTSARALSSARRGPNARQTTEQVLADLERMVSALIKENHDLSRQIDRFSSRAVGTASGTLERTLRSIQRRVSGAVDGGTTTGRRRSSARQVARTRAKITDPELLERRRQALAKARAARSAKRASAS
jgi:hypothetical protein